MNVIIILVVIVVAIAYITRNRNRKIVSDLKANQTDAIRKYSKRFRAEEYLPSVYGLDLYHAVKEHIDGYNKLECASYRTDEKHPNMLRGTVGEEWTVTNDKLLSKYELADGEPIVLDKIADRWVQIRTKPANENAKVLAFRFPIGVETQINTGWANLQLNGKGNRDADWIVVHFDANGEPDYSSVGVVNAEVFANTYKKA